MIVFLVGIIGVIIGAVIVSVSVSYHARYYERKAVRFRELENYVKEIETLNLLNKKINEILQKREIYLDKSVNFMSMDDCYISIDDFIYLESFSAQNNFYLPTYLVEEFFKKISHRKVILTPDEVATIGGSTYKDGRVILENFSEELMDIIEDKKKQMKRLTNKPIYYYKRETY